MNTELLAALGMSQSELREMIVSRAVDALIEGEKLDDDDFEGESESLSRAVSKMVKARIDAKVDEIANRVLMPKIDMHIDEMVLQQTSQWGEKQGAPMTVTEYLVSRANAYMAEQVDHNGNPKGTDGYNWRAHSTRIAHAIDKHLGFEIERAMKESLKQANSAMAHGLHEACRTAINNVAEQFKVVAKT